MTRKRGYVEVGQVFGWIVFLALAAVVIYGGNVLYVSYHDGWTKGHTAGTTYAASPDGHRHGQDFERALTAYLHTHRDGFPNMTLKDRAYNQGWDDGFHDIVDKILR